MSWPITLADYPVLMESLAVHAEDFDPTCRETVVWAPCCGRRTPADTVIALGGLVTEVRPGNHLPKTDLDFACDGCRHLLILDGSNGWTWTNLFSALGAPDEIVRHYLAKEVEEEARKQADIADSVLIKKGEPALGFNPEEAYEVAQEQLPVDLTDDLATRAPVVEVSTDGITDVAEVTL